MTNENNRQYDVLVANPEANGRLSKVGTAYPTQKGAGYRATLKVGISEGSQILLLPSRTQPRIASPESLTEFWDGAEV